MCVYSGDAALTETPGLEQDQDPADMDADMANAGAGEELRRREVRGEVR